MSDREYYDRLWDGAAAMMKGLLWGLFLTVVITLFVGCAPKTYERIVTDTVTVERFDTVIITLRPVDVDVPLPQIHLEQWVALDSLSILDNGLYQSVVEVKDGQIHHTLKPVAESLPATVEVADTTHITNTATTHVHHEKEKVTVVKEESWWSRFKGRVGALALIVILILIVLFVVRKRLHRPI